ncbi:PIN domain-containing protein [Paractinoplanes toevensis]|uniref:Ribonuclease VapC n=1 Tax=Paractinoplanes toevensis TaxID=571911 RepID=A0A919WDM2_9ACTN|nr:PIN domain-containing protein [Actinoplanes toevensis]GIM98211.1 ribonuclease VapC [Actinoplanes toevensis]
MKYLIDASVLVRFVRGQTDPAWDELVRRGLVSVCEPALAETLKAADSKKYSELEELIAGKCLPVTVPDNVWEIVASIRRELALHSAHQGPSVADLVIAATAIRLKLTVLHEDGDFETMARFVPELRKHLASAGLN